MSTVDNQGHVSIVIPIYNPDKVFFKQAIDSILNQRMLPAEIILSDDTEELEEYFIRLIETLRETGAKIVYIKNKGAKGIFSNLNHALRHASGEFVQFFCQDDIMNDDLIGKHVQLLLANPKVGVVFSQFDAITELGHIHPLEKQHHYRKSLPDYIKHQDMMYYFLKLGCLPGNLSPVMIRRSLIHAIGYFDPDFTFAGDFEYWVRAATKFDFYFCKDVLLNIRRHDQQASKTISDIELIRERGMIYSFLLEHQENIKRKWQIRLYLNRVIGSQHIHKLMKGLLLGKISKEDFYSYIRLLNHGPFNFTASFLLYIFTANNRFPGILLTSN